jgi:hypothetical protein
LIRNPDRSDFTRRQLMLRQDLSSHLTLRLPNLKWIMLDPTALWVILSKLTLRHPDTLTVAIKQDRSGTRRPLVQSKYDSHV